MAKSSEDCIFCKMANGKVKVEKVGESNSVFAIRDIKPRTKGHTLIIPKQHWVTLLDIPDKYGDELLEFTKKIATGLLHDKHGDGFNLVMNNLSVAGQVVMHAHIHIIPRKEDDGLKIVQ